MKKILLIAPLIGLATVSCGGDSSEKIQNGIEVTTTSQKNIEEMIQNMERFHESCEGESMTFRASGERMTIRIWDDKYPKEDVDKAIEKIKDTILSDADIDNMKYGYLIIKGNRVIE
jgi:hypothetical protein